MLYVNVIHRDRQIRKTPCRQYLSVRLNDQERALLEEASSQARTNVSDFVRRRALEAAELDVLERRHDPRRRLGAFRGLGCTAGA
jgi:uncharacterized protein (DUF1778 family)